MTTKKHPSQTTAQAQLSLFPQAKQEIPVLDTVHQYFFVISPPEAIKSKVRSLKQKLNRAVGLSDYNLHAVPGISLMSFHTMRPVNERFIQAVQQLFSNNHAFEVKLNGFEHFEHGNVSNTIYAKLHNSDQIVKLYQELHVLLGLRVRSFVPHLTIARTISRSRFEKSFSLVNKNNFDEKFVCNSVTILERKLEHGVVGKYSILKEIKLED
ncbi:MAG: 2'-5' RNA ligase family protein [Bacteroidota bacterium]